MRLPLEADLCVRGARVPVDSKAVHKLPEPQKIHADDEHLVGLRDVDALVVDHVLAVEAFAQEDAWPESDATHGVKTREELRDLRVAHDEPVELPPGPLPAGQGACLLPVRPLVCTCVVGISSLVPRR
eukprot:CAMPEP_0206275288 /NCGR_PEP_ID=MMETSP0047_2-20121206/35657_1 /ASSEMBLY_ACC=CAM_ASM_000192 /TAXON_ID=195065 /ORGANISM="Chroomonas mesostigmatica_cf, Strain CCMP1168" /LENGTH=127 /DNA_ID=CAMNT_0053704657 /DNA_START=246 /DNA_END=626 /DNA_ORIENTATION=-